MKLLTADQMRQAEAATNAGGLSYAAMMESAGRAATEEIARLYPPPGRTALVLVGPGNNGGDGLVVARRLSERQAQVTVYLWRTRSGDDPNLRSVEERGIPIVLAGSDSDWQTLAGVAERADIIVDALLGTGAARPISGTMKDMLETVRGAVERRRAAGRRTLVAAIDVPSGLNADTGALDPAALPADLTVTFAFPKRGLYLFPGAGAVGELVTADIGIAAQAAQNVRIEVSERRDIARRLPQRRPDANKGTFGKVLVVAGSENYSGAAYLAATAAYRAGAGLVTLAVPRSIQPILAAKTTECTFILPEEKPDAPGHLGLRALETVMATLETYDALVLGCGLGTHPVTRAFVQRLAGELGRLPRLRAIIDADGLNNLAATPQWWETLPPGLVLTPHPGEMARLLATGIADVQARRIETAQEAAARWRQVVILKGAYSIIAAPDGRTAVNPFAGAAMATAGAGDVLAGAVGGLLGQGLDGFTAAVAAAYLHAQAGEMVAARLGDAGMLAGDLLPMLPRAVRHIKRAP